MRTMKSALSLILSFVMFFTVTSASLAMDVSNTEIVIGDYQSRMLIVTDEYNKMEVINLKTGEVSYAESFLQKDGSYKYVTTEGKLVETYVNKGDKIKITSNNGQIKYVDINNEMTNENMIKSTELKMQPNLMSVSIPNTNWRVYKMGNGSRSADIGSAVGVISLIAGIFGVPLAAISDKVVGAILGIAGIALSNYDGFLYYSYVSYNRINNGWIELKGNITFFYDSGHHDYAKSAFMDPYKYRPAQ